jgi:hypothetical protein
MLTVTVETIKNVFANPIMIFITIMALCNLFFIIFDDEDEETNNSINK